MNTILQNIIKQAIDIHVHIGPEIIPRKYNLSKLVKEEKEKIGGFVLKNHFYPTQPFINELDNAKDLRIFGGLALNNAVGGMNKEAIYASSLLTDQPFIVWFPTINANNFLQKSEFEIAPEWVQQKTFQARKAKDIQPVLITKGKILQNEVVDVLVEIKKRNAVLATGHISWEESLLVVNKAKKIGISKMVITHPIYQRINMPITVQKTLVKNGCFIEQTYSMFSIDKIPMRKIAEQIKTVGSRSIILSSDVGQAYSPPPSKSLYIFSQLLQKEGISNNELLTMLVTNPKKLLSIDYRQKNDMMK